MKVLLVLIIGIIAVYAVLLLVLYRYQERFIFFPTHLEADYSFPYFNNFEEYFLQTADGERLHALRFRTSEPKGVLLYFHGNARSLDDWGFAAQEFTKHGWEVLMPDYRGYGKSSGQRNAKILFDDARRWYELCLKWYSPAQIILYGRSLGSGMATQLASVVPAKQLILETPFYSMQAMVRAKMPFLPTGLLRFPFSNDKYVRSTDIPILILHGTTDTLIPLSQAQALANVSDRATLVIVEGGGHNNLSDFDTFQKTIQKVLSD